MENEQLEQLRALYETTTAITSRCFEACTKGANARLEDGERGCITNCAANFLHTKLILAQHLVATARAQQQ